MRFRRPHLRPVGPDERAPEKEGSLETVVEDLEVAHGHVVEAIAEAAEVPGDTDDLAGRLLIAEAAVTKALHAAHRAQHPTRRP